MTRRLLLLCCGLLAILWVLCVEYRLWNLHDLTDWSTWYNTVTIACQERSNEQIVERLLGKPIREESMDRLSYPWVARYVRSPGKISNVYLYSHMSFRNRGLWYAYVFLDANGDVVGYRVFTASDFF